MQSIATIGAAQLTRNVALLSQPSRDTPLAYWATLEPLRQRNALLDFVFYDLGRLSAEDVEKLAPRYAREGSILRVGPSQAPTLDVWWSLEAMPWDKLGPIAAIVVAGVGSSALGAAAFARNVADAVGGPTLAVVSGYGLSDLLTEAISGFYLFGAVNRFRHAFERLDDVARLRLGATSTTVGDGIAEIRASLDVSTLTALLLRAETPLLVGHSKGNLVIAEALFACRDAAPTRFGEIVGHTRIVTVSARIAMPKECTDVINVIGSVDPLGELNSRQGIKADVVVPFAGHHTNVDLQGSLKVTPTLA